MVRVGRQHPGRRGKTEVTKSTILTSWADNNLVQDGTDSGHNSTRIFMEKIGYCYYYLIFIKLGMCKKLSVSSVNFDAEPSVGVESFHIQERTEPNDMTKIKEVFWQLFCEQYALKRNLA
jgi:hypothetical protein